MVDYTKYLNKQLQEAKNWKQKLYSKTMTLDAFWTTWERFLDIFEDLNFMVTVVNTVVSLIDFDISLDLDLEFEFPEVTQSYKETVRNWGYQKAIYGVSTYDNSYYDPEDWYKAVSLLKRFFLTKVMNYPAGKSMVPAISTGLEIVEPYSYDKACRIIEVLYAILNWTICGFAICGYSRLGPAVKIGDRWYGLLLYNTPDLKESRVVHASVFELAYAPHAGRQVCGFSRAIPRNRIDYIRYASMKVWSQLLESLRNSIREQRDRFLFNLSGAKLVTGKPLHLESRVEAYGNKMLIISNIDFTVKQMLKDIVHDPTKLQNYVNFVKELIFGRVKKHTKYRKGWIYTDEQSYINYLLEKYSKMGLDKNILNILLNRFLPFAKHYWYRSKLY